MELPVILGFLGDSVNLFAAILLSLDPLRRKGAYFQEQTAASLPADVPFIDYNNKPVVPVEKLKQGLAGGETTHARWGFGLLILGFMLLFVARVLEARRPAAIKQPQTSQETPPVSRPVLGEIGNSGRLRQRRSRHAGRRPAAPSLCACCRLASTSDM